MPAAPYGRGGTATTSEHSIGDTPPAENRQLVFVVPCGRAKLDTPAPARSLYIGQMFRYCFATAEREAVLAASAGATTKVLILSARYGLLDPDTEIEPYEQTMTSASAVDAHRLADQFATVLAGYDTEVVVFLPKAYLVRLRDAVALIRRRHGHKVSLRDAYQTAPGIGYQRQVLAALRRSQSLRSGHGR
ncbi:MULTISPECIES: DUF6884 domain-containing protein [Actinosynnema]|uniref:DUF6884 domain-containing protein n=1 Tax=Actinosynnema TaxID=40566 RepID=UPI0020A59F19|nr:DUF6884 domain-containing protein [Actinosynnema pretiosum]MCP2097453.1 hypothetical protein [Actinosynnema pretiosum]